MEDIYLVKWRDKVMKLLKNQAHNDKYDKSQVLMLFKMNDFDEGIIYLCEVL